MKQSIPGVTPADLAEVTCKVVWPTIAATQAGKLVGCVSSIRLGLGSFFTVGTLMAVATIPISLAVFAWQLMPFVCRRYTITNRRIVIRKGLSALDDRWISFDDFDAIDVAVLPGQAWFHAGDLSFRRGGTEVLRLAGVPRPETVRRYCLTAQNALISVREVLRHQASEAA